MVRNTMMWHIWRSWLPLFCSGDCDAKMVAVLFVFTAFLAVLIAAILRMYFNQLVPEGLPVNQHHKLRIVGLITKLTGMVVSLSYYMLFNVFVYSKSIMYVTFLFEVSISLLWFYNYFINILTNVHSNDALFCTCRFRVCDGMCVLHPWP